MNTHFYKISSFSLALLVLISSSFVVIDEHYCCGKLDNFSFFGKADVCAMDVLSCKEENKEGTTIKMANCCVSRQDVKSGAIFEKTVTNDFIALSAVIIPPLFSVIPEAFENFIYKTSYFHKYSPPLISQDIGVLFQCFIL